MANNSRVSLVLPIAIVGASAAISTASIFIRFAQAEGAPSVVIAALRLSFATLMLAPIAFIKHREELRKISHTQLVLGAASGIFLAIHFTVWITSLEFTSVASSALFVSSGPLWVALLSPLLLNEKMTRAAILGLVLALFGGTIIGLSDACSWKDSLSCPELEDALQGRAMWGNFLALAGAWAITGYLIIGRKVRAGMSLIPYIFLVYGMAALTLLTFMTVTGNSPFGFSSKAYGSIFLLAAVPQLIGHSTFNWALRYLPASLVSVASLGEPIGAAALAFFILQESPSRFTLAGGVFILLGIYLSSRNT